MTAGSQSLAMVLLNSYIRLTIFLPGDDSDSMFFYCSSLRWCCVIEDRLCPLKDNEL